MTLQRTGKLGYGVVDKAIVPHRSGRIKFQGSYWKAELADPNCGQLEAGEPVQVVGVQGITLLVIPEGYEISEQPHQSGFERQDGRRSLFDSWAQKFSAVFAVAIS